MSPPFSVFFTPSGKFEPSSVSRTLTSGLARGLGVHEYHSLMGATNVAGTPFRMGCAGSSAFTRAVRQELVLELAPLRERARDEHPWREWANAAGGEGTRMPGGQSRWSAGKELSWEPVRIERVCEVKYDHMQGSRFRHAAVFLRWRPDKRPIDCRYDQLEVTTAYELAKVFGAGQLGARKKQ